MILSLSLLLAAATAPEESSDPRALSLMHKFATCVVRGQREEVRATLLLPAGSPESIKALRTFAAERNRCLNVNGRLRMSEPLLRVALAEVAYKDEFVNPSDEAAELKRPFVGSGNRDLFGQDVAACVALRDPGAAHRFVHAKAGSSAEKAAMQNVGLAISSCIPAKVEARFKRYEIKGLLAEALYRARHTAASYKSSQRASN